MVRNNFYVLIDNHFEDTTIVSNPTGWVNYWSGLMTDIAADAASVNRVLVDLYNEPDSHGFTWTSVRAGLLMRPAALAKPARTGLPASSSTASAWQAGPVHALLLACGCVVGPSLGKLARALRDCCSAAGATVPAGCGGHLQGQPQHADHGGGLRPAGLPGHQLRGRLCDGPRPDQGVRPCPAQAARCCWSLTCPAVGAGPRQHGRAVRGGPHPAGAPKRKQLRSSLLRVQGLEVAEENLLRSSCPAEGCCALRRYGLSDPNDFFTSVASSPFQGNMLVGPHVYPPSITTATNVRPCWSHPCIPETRQMRPCCGTLRHVLCAPGIDGLGARCAQLLPKGPGESMVGGSLPPSRLRWHRPAHL